MKIYTTFLLSILILCLANCTTSKKLKIQSVVEGDYIQEYDRYRSFVPVTYSKILNGSDSSGVTMGRWSKGNRVGLWKGIIKNLNYAYKKTYVKNELNGPFAIWNRDSSIVIKGNYCNGELCNEYRRTLNGVEKIVPLNDIDLLYAKYEGAPLRSKKNLMYVVEIYSSDLKYTYNKYLKKRPKFKGKVNLKLFIQPDGIISKINIVGSNTGYKEFDTAIASQVKTWFFKPGAKSRCVVTLPFSFSE